jgi:hypothetical protein
MTLNLHIKESSFKTESFWTKLQNIMKLAYLLQYLFDGKFASQYPLFYLFALDVFFSITSLIVLKKNLHVDFFGGVGSETISKLLHIPRLLVLCSKY